MAPVIVIPAAICDYDVSAAENLAGILDCIENGEETVQKQAFIVGGFPCVREE
jgi:hypothetical protein